jgi:hypothetical protein
MQAPVAVRPPVRLEHRAQRAARLLAQPCLRLPRALAREMIVVAAARQTDQSAQVPGRPAITQGVGHDEPFHVRQGRVVNAGVFFWQAHRLLEDVDLHAQPPQLPLQSALTRRKPRISCGSGLLRGSALGIIIAGMCLTIAGMFSLVLAHQSLRSAVPVLPGPIVEDGLRVARRRGQIRHPLAAVHVPQHNSAFELPRRAEPAPDAIHAHARRRGTDLRVRRPVAQPQIHRRQRGSAELAARLRRRTASAHERTNPFPKLLGIFRHQSALPNQCPSFPPHPRSLGELLIQE